MHKAVRRVISGEVVELVEECVSFIYFLLASI